jgi:hypothetical protein
MSKNSLRTLGLVLVVVVGTTLSARANLNMTFTWDGTYYQAGYSAQYLVPADAIGIYKFNTKGEASFPNPYWSVCLDPAGLLNGSTHTYDHLSFSEANPGLYPTAWAWNQSGPNPEYWGINNAAFLWSTYGMKIVQNSDNLGDQNQRAAALAFAVWTALYNSTDYGKLDGTAWSAPVGQMGDPSSLHSTRYYYDGYLNDLITLGPDHATFTGDILRGENAVKGGANSGESQEFFFLVSPVPEPATVIAGALLLLPLGASTLRILRRNRTA